ncbi:MAG: hypothetical protein AAFN43_00445 [Pseudomonadota bacterium]
MIRALVAALFAALGVLSPAVAQNIPEFLVGKVYSTDTSQCGDVVDAEGDVLQLSKEGIFGQEFGCTFTGFQFDRDPQTGRVYSVVATANCGDDSGISRPDLMTLSPYEEGGQVVVGSQNEYILGETEIMIAEKLGREFPERNSYAWVSKTYNLCK